MMTARGEKVALGLAIAVLTLGPAPAAAQRRGDCGGMEPSGSHGVVAAPDEPGERMWVEGQVVDRDGSPLAGVEILAYQTDDEGYYSIAGGDEANARLCVVVVTDAGGRYSLDTIRPGGYPSSGVPRHIHFELWGDGIRRQRRDLQFADDPRLPASRRRDTTRFSTVQPVARGADGVWRVTRDFRLE